MGITTNQAIWEAESYGLELLHITIGDLVDQQAAAFPEKIDSGHPAASR